MMAVGSWITQVMPDKGAIRVAADLRTLSRRSLGAPPDLESVWSFSFPRHLKAWTAEVLLATAQSVLRGEIGRGPVVPTMPRDSYSNLGQGGVR